LNYLPKVFYNDAIFGFVFPKDFQNKEKFIENFKLDDAFKNYTLYDNYTIANDKNYITGEKRSVTEYRSITDNVDKKQKVIFKFFNNQKNNDTINEQNIIKNSKRDHYDDYITKYKSYTHHYYDYNPHYNTEKNVKCYILTLDNEQEFQNYPKISLYGIVFKSQTDYTIRMNGYYDIASYLYREYSKIYSGYPEMARYISLLSFIQNAVDQALIKTLTNTEYNVHVNDKIIEQKKEMFDFPNNPANSYLPYIILFFFV